MKEFQYDKTLKTKPDDSFLNLQSYLHISAKQITKFLYNTPVTPHQVIFVSMVFGVASSFMIINDNKIIAIAGAVLLFYKNVLDKVDGSLARAKNMDSRRGRFYDSLSDFIVTFSVFTAVSFNLYSLSHNWFIFLIGYAAMVCSMLQCSFFIYYQVSFIKISGKETVNRLIEKVTDEDFKNEDKFTILLQRIFMVIYGWQDIFFASVDNFLYKKLELRTNDKSLLNYLWYKDKPFLTGASILSIGSHILLLSISAVTGNFICYLFVNLILFNLLLILILSIHYNSVKNKIISSKI